MTDISGIGRLAQAIRLHGATAQSKPPDAHAPSAGKVVQEQQRSSDFRAQAALRLREISPDDPQRRRKAFRIFLEGTLSDLLGDEAPADPAFQGLIDRVQLAMETDPELVVDMDRAADVLLSR